PPSRTCCSKHPAPPKPTPFPYTTLFRSCGAGGLSRRKSGSVGADAKPRGRARCHRCGGGREKGRRDRARHLARWRVWPEVVPGLDRKSTRLNSSHSQISYAVFCLKKKTL